MDEIIEKQIENENPDDVLELILDSWKGPKIPESGREKIETYPNIDTLSFSGCGLESLESFPNCSGLIKLDLSSNKIKDGLSHLKHLKEIMQINLMKNLIEDINEFKCFQSFQAFVYLEVEGCPIASEEGVKEKLFKMLPTLQIIDGVNRNGEYILPDDYQGEDSEESEEPDSNDEIEASIRLKGNDTKGNKK